MTPRSCQRRLARSIAFLVVAATAAPCWGAKPKKEAKKSEAAPAAAPAPSPPAPTGPKSLTDSLSGEAKADYDSGKLLYGDGDYAGARVKFQAAFDLSQDPRLLWNMAACEKGQRHYAKVVTLVKKYLELGGALLGEDDRKDANDLLSAIESFTVGLAINVDEAGAQIFVDGEPVGESPLAVPVTVDIGTRQIEVKKPGFAPFSRTVPVGGTKQAVLDVKLTREVHEGVLAVGAPAKATIFIDSKAVGVGSFVGNLASGGHTLRVDAPGFRSYQSEVVIQDHERRDVDVVLEPIAAASAAPAEPEGALHGLELGAYLGYGTQSNHMHVDIDNNNGSNGMTQGQDQTATVNFIPIGIDIGYRLGRPTYLGIFGEVGTLDRSGTCGVARHGPNEDFPGDPAVRYGYTNCVMFKAGVVLAFHLLPRTIVDPYFGFEAAVHASDAHFRSFDPLTGQTTDGTDSNGSFQPAFRIGVDSHPLPGLGAGIFARLGPVFGGEGKPSDSNGNNCPQNNSQQNGSTSACPTVNTSTDVGTQVSFGIRAAYTFQ